MTMATQLFPLVAAISISFLSAARASNSTSSHSSPLQNLLIQLTQWREHGLVDPSSHVGTARGHGIGLNTVLAWILAFLAASVSSAGGVGGGSLYLPILNLVAGISLKRATAYSSFMVTGGAASNVLYNLLCTGGGGGRHAAALIDYDIALLFQPCLLLGVSIGVVCNIMFPEWLITVLFSLLLAFCTAKTCRAGAKIWRSESGAAAAVTVHEHKEPLLQGPGGGADNGGAGASVGFPWKDVAVLVTVWLCFFVLHVFIGDKHGKGMIGIKPCGVAYWLFTISQVPFAVAFTGYIIYVKRKKQVQCNREDGKANLDNTNMGALPSLVFPLAAFVTGSLSGLFGIGGGLLLNPVLLQIGIPPQTAAATSSFMVLFCASMSMVQFILLGMKGIREASVYAGICFVASVVGLVVIERAVRKSGRVSLIVLLGAFNIRPCGVAYWLITVAQIPIAVAFTACIAHQKRKSHSQNNHLSDQAITVKSKLEALLVYVFPLAALLTGIMSGLFGIGGGLLLKPVLLQIGVPPKTASATTMFLVLFCASMSMVQFIILGVDGIVIALVYAATCFVASIVGLVVIEGVIRKSGRVSLIVFMVAAILALSAFLIACSGAVRVWVQYMGFKLPC